MGADQIRLKLLLQQKHWQTYAAFCREYNRVAREIDRGLIDSYPSRAQFHRWLSGDVKGLPYSDHCRVLEALLPGWTVGQLFEPGLLDEPSSTPRVPKQPTPDDAQSSRGLFDVLALQGFADVAAVFPTRSEFTSKVPPHALFDDARELRIAGLSLNILCQQYADDHLRKLISSGATVRCLFLDPAGEAIRARELEEGLDPGTLVTLTELNMRMLTHRVRGRLPEADRERLIIGKYDEVIRFNVTLIDQSLAVVQPYLHGIRGLEAPTLMLRNDGSAAGLFPIFERMFTWLWDRSTFV